MIRYIKGISIILGCALLALMSSSVSPSSHAQVGTEYAANYGISQTWDNIMTNFITIQATRKRGDQVPASVFQSLHTDFTSIFPRLPQRNNYRIIYDTCKAQSLRLSQVYTSIDFDIFMDQCHGPLNTAMKEINANFTIKAQVKATPNSGSAPLTVTLDARSTTDPSNDTIPSQNFYRYYKNTQGQDILIGRGSVVNYTFEQEGNYYVHLTARSANNTTQGILDGSATTVISVAPEIANLVVYANGKRLQQRNHVKIGTQDAQNGVVLDASASMPRGGRELQTHSWEIIGPNGFKYVTDILSGKPGVMTTRLPANGAYTVRLSATDNEQNTITKSFLIAVSDPIAIIRMTPENITTSSMINFDASASYSLSSRIRRYQWEIFDDTGDTVFITQQKSMSRQLKQPGSYTIKLTVTDDLGETNIETQVLEVESTPPQAQFTTTPRLDRQYPSQFVLDATASFDIDQINEFDTISYEWSFSNPTLAKIEQEYDNGQALVVSFEEPGKHTVTLTVSDNFGQVSQVSREIDVKSSLRPVILANPRATMWGKPIRLMVTANQDIASYERNLGDGNTQIVQTPVINHVFRKAGVYHVKLTVTDRRGNTNSVTSPVFVGEANSPIGAFSVTNSRGHILRATEECEGQPAYPVYRQERIVVNASESVNSKGEKSNLQFYFKPQDDEIYANNAQLQYNFANLGCRKVDVVVEETNTSRQDNQTVWFRVFNALPTIDSMNVFFPQFGNEVGIGLQQGSKEKTFDPTKVDNLIVKVTANNPKDTDGTITQYIWYYYKKDDPTRMLEMRSTPGNVPFTHFSILTNDPSLGAGDIVFGVKLVDNDGGEQHSEDMIGQGPSFFNPPCTGGRCDYNMDVPIVTLKASTNHLAVGEEITFTTSTRVLSNRPDFAANRVIRYDFDGDGTWDLVTKDTEVKHTYIKPIENIKPRVEVTYRKNSVVFVGEEITIAQTLKPLLETHTYDKTVYVRDYSLGMITKREICFNGLTSCQELQAGEDISYTYESYGEKTFLYRIYDDFGNRPQLVQTITLTETDNLYPVYLMSIPRAVVNAEGRFEIAVANNQQDSVLMRLVYPGTGECYMDTDITLDSNFDEKPDNDKDLLCNVTRMIKFDPYSQMTNARIYYTGPDGKIAAAGVIVTFTEQNIVLSQEQRLHYNQIQNLMRSLPQDNDDQLYIRSLLLQMADNVRTGRPQTEQIINMRVFLENTTAGLSESQIGEIRRLLSLFDTSDSVGLNGGTVLDQVRQALVDFAPGERMKEEIKARFQAISDIPEPSAQPEVVKGHLQAILQIFIDNSVSPLEIQNAGNEEKIISDDVEIVVIPDICRVMTFYDITSNLCPDGDNSPVVESGTQTGLGGILRRVGIGVAILGGIVLLIVVFFAVKARLQSNEDEE